MNTLLMLIPSIAFVLLIILFVYYSPLFTINDSRICFLLACLTFTTLIVGMNELLSISSLLTHRTILIVWIIVFSLEATWLFLIRKKCTFLRAFSLPHYSRLEWLCLLSVIFILASTALTAFLGAPNNYDSMTYHLSRVMHWEQNQSVEFYPTNILRQLHMAPGAEYIILQWQLLTLNDYFANAVQWFAFLGCVIGISHIAKLLGSNRKTQILSALLTATIPMAILQSSSTQNDLVVTFWLVCLMNFILLAIRGQRLLYWLAIGCSLGLAVFTKATAYIFAAPILIWFAVQLLRNNRIQWLKAMTLIVGISMILNVAAYNRNYHLFNFPLGPRETDENHYSNDIYTIQALTSNIARNLAIHLSTPVQPLNTLIEQSVITLHSWIDISTNDPRTTYLNIPFSLPRIAVQNDADIAPNFFHLVLSIFSSIYLIITYHKKNISPHIFIYGGIIIVSFLLFCAYLRWQPWNSRLHLPLFILFTPVIAYALSKFQQSTLHIFTIIGIIVMSIPFALYNTSHHLIGSKTIFSTSREEQYFTHATSYQKSYYALLPLLQQQSCTQIGLITNNNDPEYLLWPLLRQNQPTAQIHHAEVTNDSARLSFSKHSSCAIISLRNSTNDVIVVNGTQYKKIWSDELLSLFVL